MSMGFLMYVAFVIALAAAAGWAAESLCRQYGRATRWAWLAASVVALLIITRAALKASESVVPATRTRIAMPALGTAGTLGRSPLEAVRAAIASFTAVIGLVTDTVVRAIPDGVTSLAAFTWIAASLTALAVLLFVHLRIRRARRDWAEAELFGTRVRIAPDVGPAVVGVMRPQIVVPSWLLGRSASEQQLVLAHEREHLGARDHLLLGAGSLVVALVPWHPAAWWMLARLRLAIELDCDARVLRRGVPARTYGTLLIDLAGRCTGFRVGATALADEGSHLERRLLAMKADSTKRSLLRAGMLGLAAALALLAACEAKVPTGPEIQAMDVASATKAVTRTRLLQKTEMDSAVFYVDGSKVDSRTANALTPNQIATIDVSKGTGRPVIRIATTGQAPKASDNAGALLRAKRLADTLGSVDAVRMKRSAAKEFAGLLLIDGVKSDQSAMAALDPKNIESVQVLKGAAAEKLSSDPVAKNGIIMITTKK